MTYQETIEFLYNQLPVFHRIGKAAYKDGLGNILQLDEYLGCPHRHFKTIHVGGTNGKGSVSHMLAAVLQAAGFKTGLYTSPHLVDFRERIRINGAMMAEEDVIRFVKDHFGIIQSLHPSFFEMSVGMAFDYFARNQVDIAVVEVGLGGRFDSTNIISPLVSIITNISWDHMDLLGDTLQKIAFEKAGIIKPGIPVIIGERQPEVQDVFIEQAALKSSPICFASDHFELTPLKDKSDREGKPWRIVEDTQWEWILETDLVGLYQKKNIATVLQTLKMLEASLHVDFKAFVKEAFPRVVSLTGLQGRWQKISATPLIICDTGHNEAGIREITAQLRQLQFNQLHFIYGVVKDKPLPLVLSQLPKQAVYYFTRAEIPRALDPLELKTAAIEYGLKGDAFEDIFRACQAAIKNANSNDLIFVGGSTFVVADFLSIRSKILL